MRWENLTESKAPSNSSVIEFIQKNCKQYIQENPEWVTKLLYRGIDNYDDIAIHQIRTDRRPLDTNPFLHDLYNDSLKKAGFTAIRTNSMFCTGKKAIASQYGAVYVIFPIGNFAYTWSSSYTDLTNSTSRIMSNGGFKFKNIDEPVLSVDDLDLVYASEKEEFAKHNFPEKFSYNFMVDKILPVTGSDKEIWFRTVDKQIISKKLKLDQSALVNNFKENYRVDDLPEAIDSGSEIMIAGSSYLAIDVYVWKKITSNHYW